jgi:hypothetical protein
VLEFGVVSCVDTLAHAAAAVLLGFQLLFFGVAAKASTITEGLLPQDESFGRWFKFVTLETGLSVGVSLVLVGLGVAASSVVSWAHCRVWAAAAGGDDAAHGSCDDVPDVGDWGLPWELLFEFAGCGGGKAGRSFADKSVVTIFANSCADK